MSYEDTSEYGVKPISPLSEFTDIKSQFALRRSYSPTTNLLDQQTVSDNNPPEVNNLDILRAKLGFTPHQPKIPQKSIIGEQRLFANNEASIEITAFNDAAKEVDKGMYDGTSSRDFVKKIHKIIGKGIDWAKLKSDNGDRRNFFVTDYQAGKYRKYTEVGKADNNNSYYIHPNDIEEFMNSFSSKLDEMIEQVRGGEVLTSQALVTWAHLNFVSIHPFIDGNGRVAELLMNLICRKLKIDPINLNRNKARIAEIDKRLGSSPLRIFKGTNYIEYLKFKTDYLNDIRNFNSQKLMDTNNPEQNKNLRFLVSVLETGH